MTRTRLPRLAAAHKPSWAQLIERTLALCLALALAPVALGWAATPQLQLLDAGQVLQLCSLSDPEHALFTTPGGVRVNLDLSPSAAAFTRPVQDDRFHPYEPGQIQAALAELTPLPGPPLEVTIYCLPGWPHEQGRSFCIGKEIFLAPGLGPLSANVSAYTVIHELGHVLEHERLPGRSSAQWWTYLRLRGLDDAQRFAPDGPHAWRPAEVFAEDFRALYGGPHATYSGTLENPTLVAPGEVVGLRAFFEDVLRGELQAARPLAGLSNYPNPFNPSTTIRVRMRPEATLLGGKVSVTVFDARGRRVRDLPPEAVAPVLEFRWDGTDAGGRHVASGRYLYRVWVGEEPLAGSMLLLK